MTALLKRVFDIERKEITRALLMFLYAFLLLSAYLILKPVRNSLFLNRFGADQLVYMYMIIAATATPIAWIYGWTAARTTLPKLVGGTTIVLVLSMGVFWYLIAQHYSWLIYVFYVWVSLFGVFTTSQFWLLANYVFDAREAKRLFPFIGAGAISGGILGSILTSQLAELVGTENLLWFCVLFMIACFGILLAVWRMRQGDDPKKAKRKRKSRDLSGMLPIILRSRHLKLIAIMISLTVIVSTFVDFQFNKVVKEAFDDKDKLTAFFGAFFLWLSVASLLLQLLFSSRILRRFGIGGAILFLPIGLLLGSTAIFVWPVLMSAIAVKISDGSFRYSINKTGMELLYLPVSAAIKGRIKAFMDVVGDRLARGLGGALLYLVNDIMQWPVQWISFLSAAFISVWIAVAVLLKREYSRTFRTTLDTRAIDAEEVQLQLRDAASIEAVTNVLASGDRRQILFVLELLVEEKDPRLAAPLSHLLSHDSADVRKMALRRLMPLQNGNLIETIELLLKDTDAEVQAEAVRYICLHSPSDTRDLLEGYMASDDPQLVSIAVRCALECGRERGVSGLLTSERLEHLLSLPEKEGIQVRKQLAGGLAYLSPDDPLADLVSRLLTDRNLEVRRAALDSAARLKRREYLPEIINSLGLPSLRGPAGLALLSYGQAVLGTLRDAMLDTAQSLPVRLRIPKIISQMDTEEAAGILFAQISIDDALLRYVIIKGLNRARRRLGDLPLEIDRIRSLIRSEAEGYYRLLNYESAVATGNNGNRAEQLLLRALKDGRNRHLEQAFRLAGLIYPINDMYFAYRGAVSQTKIFRARAVEFLDTVWERQEKQQLFPILERQSDLVVIGRKLFQLVGLSRSEAIRDLLRGHDLWLAACASNLVGTERLQDHREDVAKLTGGPHSAVRETARVALERLRQTENDE